MDGKTTVVSGRLRITLSAVPEGERLTSGAIVSLPGELKPLRSFANPGGYDFAAREHRKDIYGRLTAKFNMVALSGEIEESWRDKTEKFLSSVKTDMQKRMPKEDQAVIMGMLFGGYDELSPEVVRDFSTTGIVHILSVSGTHVAMVAGAIFWLARRLRLDGRKAALLSMAGVLVYSALSGFAIPVVRSTAMGIAVLAGLAAGRRAHTASILGIVLLVMLIFQPRWLLEISFQLSFAATAGIVFLYQPIKERLARLPDFLAAALALTLAVQIAVLPFLAHYFYQVSLVAFLANIIILPLAEACLLLALAGVAINMFLPLLGGSVFMAVSLLLGLALRLNSWLAAWPSAVLPLPVLPEWWWVCYYIIVFLVFDFLPLKISAQGRYIAATGVLCMGIFALATSAAPKEFSAHFIDVGQGDACLLFVPDGRTILIDAGVRSYTGDFDAGERVVAPYLRYYGVKKVNLMVLSHGHSDHAGGAAAVARQVPVETIWLPGGQSSDDTDRLLLQAKDSNAVTMYEGLNAELGGVKIEVLKVPGVGETPVKKTRDDSSVIKITFNDKTFLFMGDADKAGELAALPLLDKVNVLKVSHHGAATSSDPLFIARTDPDIAVISVGTDNSYRHPSSVTLETLAKQGSKVLRTDLEGAIMIKTAEEKLVWYGYRQTPAAFR